MELDVGANYTQQQIIDNQHHGLVVKDSTGDEAICIDGTWYGYGSPAGSDYGPYRVVKLPDTSDSAFLPEHETPDWCQEGDTLGYIPVWVRKENDPSGVGFHYNVRAANKSVIAALEPSHFQGRFGVSFSYFFGWEADKYGDLEEARKIAAAVEAYDAAMKGKE